MESVDIPAQPGTGPTEHAPPDRTRRSLLKAAMAGAALSVPMAGCATPSGTRWQGPPALGFKSIAPVAEDSVRVPEGYRVQVLNAWGDPIGSPLGAPAFRQDASNTADEQMLQSGMHHDAIEYFPLPYGSADSSNRSRRANRGRPRR